MYSHRCKTGKIVNFVSANLQKFVHLYAAVSTPMKQRIVVVDGVRVEHRLFRSSRKRQSQETGSYTVTISLENALFQWLLSYIRVVRQQDFWKCLTKM